MKRNKLNNQFHVTQHEQNSIFSTDSVWRPLHSIYRRSVWLSHRHHTVLCGLPHQALSSHVAGAFRSVSLALS